MDIIFPSAPAELQTYTTTTTIIIIINNMSSDKQMTNVSHLRPRVTDAWEAVARQQSSLALTMEEELHESDAANIKSHGDAIYYLDLSSPVVRPISLRQIRMEQIIREGGHG